VKTRSARYQLLDKLEDATAAHRRVKLRAHLRSFAIGLFCVVDEPAMSRQRLELLQSE
jgi:hypothetical protein